jgi:uncharacterized tellurite resistance protein B-like protein
MALIDLFDSGDKKKRLSHIKNLVALAASDGEIDNNELNLIFKIGARVGLSRDELLRIIQRPSSIDFKAPDYFRERIEQLYDMVLIMMIDGEIHENEVALCKLTAMRLGFRHQIIDKMIMEVIEMIVKGLALEIVLANLERQYS